MAQYGVKALRVLLLVNEKTQMYHLKGWLIYCPQIAGKHKEVKMKVKLQIHKSNRTYYSHYYHMKPALTVKVCLTFHIGAVVPHLHVIYAIKNYLNAP